jgi:hypothetical protein
VTEDAVTRPSISQLQVRRCHALNRGDRLFARVYALLVDRRIREAQKAARA